MLIHTMRDIFCISKNELTQRNKIENAGWFILEYLYQYMHDLFKGILQTP